VVAPFLISVMVLRLALIAGDHKRRPYSGQSRRTPLSGAMGLRVKVERTLSDAAVEERSPDAHRLRLQGVDRPAAGPEGGEARALEQALDDDLRGSPCVGWRAA
jgi:hypothetical protein